MYQLNEHQFRIETNLLAWKHHLILYVTILQHSEISEEKYK